jgi:hypothetical protein
LLRAPLAAGCTAWLATFLSGAAHAGAFVPGQSYDYTVGTGPRAIATGDLNEDGRPDMIVGNEGGNSVSVLLSQPGGGFAPAVNYNTGLVPGEVVIADFDGDGHLDFAVGHYNSNTVVIMRGTGTGSFTAGVTLTGPPHPEGLVAADLNGDGMLDLAACGYASTSTGMASVWLNTGTPGGTLSFGSRTDYAVGAWPNSIRTGTFANGRTGLVTANYNGASVTILDNDGTGAFPTRTDLPVPPHVYMAATGTLFPSMSRSQIATANADSSTLTLYYYNDNTLAWVRQDFSTGTRPDYVAIADADGDGEPDVVTADYVSGTLSVFEPNLQTGQLRPRVNVPTVPNAYAVAVADFDGDGKADLLASNRGGNVVRITHGLPKVGWGVGDTIPTFSAPNQNGDLTRVTAVAPSWRVLDLCSVWCAPCNYMARSTQATYLTWFHHPSVRFDYITMLVDGQTPGVASTVANASSWAKYYGITEPVLCAGGSVDSATYAVSKASDLAAYPTLRIVDPHGVIRWLNVGEVDDTVMVRRVANFAGVAVPPPYVAPNVQLYGATETVAYGTATASGAGVVAAPSTLTFGPGWTLGGVVNEYFSELAVTRDLASATESWDVACVRYNVGANTYDPVPTAAPWQFTISNLQMDAYARAKATGATATVTVYDSLGNPSTLPNPINFTWNGSSLAFDAITPQMLAPYGVIAEIDVIAPLQVLGLPAVPTGVPVGGGLVFALHAPAPNPCVRASRLSWSQPHVADAKLELYDVSGRLVRTLANGTQPAGEHAATWDLSDRTGMPVSNGLYFARLTVTGQGTRTTRVTLMR